MPEREFKIRHTTEGAEDAKANIEALAAAEKRYAQEVARLNELAESDVPQAQLESQAQAAERARAAFEALGGSTKGVATAGDRVSSSATQSAEAMDKAGASTSDFAVILDRISPGLGGLVTAMESALKVAGGLGKANLNLTGIMGGAKAAVLKYKDALMLLGAGGAAVAAVLFLISVWKKLNAEMEKALKLIEKLNEQNRVIIDKSRSFRDQVVEAVAAGEIAPLTDEEFAKSRTVKRKLVTQGFEDDFAFQVAIGQTAPPSQSVVDFVSANRGDTAVRTRAGQEVLKGKSVGTEEVSFVSEKLATTDQQTSEILRRLRFVIETGVPDAGGGFAGRNSLLGKFLGRDQPISPDAFKELDGGELFRAAQALGILQEVIDRLKQLQETSGEFLGLPPPSRARQDFEDAFKGIFSSFGFGDGSASNDRNGAGDLRDAAKALREAADRMRDDADRAADRRSSNGTTARFENMAAGEG